jgi:hypothetical protein
MRTLTLIALLGLAGTGCNSNILGFDQRQLLAQPEANYTGALPNPWYLYQDAFMTGGWFQGLAVWDNYLWVTVDPDAGLAPFSGTKALKVRYDAAGGGSPNWAELAFIHTPDYSGFLSTPGRDLSAGGFTACKFMIRTSAPATVPVQMDGVATVNVAATTAWQAVSISLPSPASQTAVKTFFQINTPSVMPLDIYIDDLRYEQ